MPKHIGIVACSAEGAALCYRTICREAPARMGEHMHPEVSMHTHPLGEYVPLFRSGDWDGVAERMLDSAEKLVSIGAQILICPDNTVHGAFSSVEKKSAVPWIHIADAVGVEAKRQGYARIGVTGTKCLMAGSVYPERLAKFDIVCELPDELDRERIDMIIFRQLVNGIYTNESRRFFCDVFEKLKERGCDAVALGGTEIPILVDMSDCPMPVLDSARLLARAALERALEDG
ncbi:aspartate/glutamate racemase family protein [Methanogenium organophilum]|uniref:Amino acid racemase n=1 Tax=Methanogenium organophilum TaxID=2199 RepID=A0A9X9T7B5_METOG|nr:amino acid racemase [Methanogenium organophilum]WAI00535.1 amino acid racemase [Methanogenium organophilum]